MKIGLVGSIIDAFCSHKRAKGPRERRFALFVVVASCVLIALFLALLFLLPQFRPEAIIAYAILVMAWGIYVGRRQSAIQKEEQTNA